MNEGEKTYFPTGTHLIADLKRCKNTEFTEEQIKSIVLAIGCTPIKYIEHKYEPQGKSAIYLLAESHVSIHTYPEHGYVAVDVYACGNNNPKLALPLLTRLFQAKEEISRIIKRGINE